MRISDWSSDVCSSDLNRALRVSLFQDGGALKPFTIAVPPATSFVCVLRLACTSSADAFLNLSCGIRASLFHDTETDALFSRRLFFCFIGLFIGQIGRAHV